MRRDAYKVDVATQPLLAREFARKLFVLGIIKDTQGVLL